MRAELRAEREEEEGGLDDEEVEDEVAAAVAWSNTAFRWPRTRFESSVDAVKNSCTSKECVGKPAREGVCVRVVSKRQRGSSPMCSFFSFFPSPLQERCCDASPGGERRARPPR